jgi:hypothetical protein
VRGKAIMMIGIAMVVGAASIFAADLWIKSAASARVPDMSVKVPAPPAQPKVEFKTIVVAKTPLRFGMTLDRDQLSEIPWPQDSLPQGALATIDSLLAESSRVVLSPIEANEPVLLAKVSGPNGRATLSNLSSPGMRAVTVKTHEIAGVVGFITPGMGHRNFIAMVAMCASLAASGCTTGAIDTTKTTAISPVAQDISASDVTLGKTQFRDANYGLAEKHFRKAVELRADNAEAWMGLAASYDQLGRFDFADRAYDQLVKVAGRKPEVVNNMGYAQLLRGNKKKARQLLVEARNSMADPTVVNANLALLNKS